MGNIIIDSNVSNTVDFINQCRAYNDYIDNHVNNVILMYNKIFKNKSYTIPEWTNEREWRMAVNTLSNHVLTHDASKYSDVEFYAYRRRFNPTEAEKEEEDEGILELVKEAFDKAWEHHYRNNYHHPQFWSYIDIVNDKNSGGVRMISRKEKRETPLDMPLFAIMHMICDWSAMTYHFSNGKEISPVKWFNEDAEKERSFMSENTLNHTKDLLFIIFNEEVK